MEGLTKNYHADILISETLYDKLLSSREKDQPPLPCRLLATVAVKGKTKGVRIYTPKKDLSEVESKAWALHNEGMELYYRRDFAEAGKHFKEVLSLLPEDSHAGRCLELCNAFAAAPPPADWDGVEVMQTK
jgi:tetratricopeptide (TPR) repeat protein